MIFNGTLIVQIGNFLVTYWFLNTFFLKKGYAVVSAENKEFDELQERVATYKKLAHEAVQKKEQAWEAYSASLHAEKPQLGASLVTSMHIVEKPIDTTVSLSPKTVAELASVLAKKVAHD